MDLQVYSKSEWDKMSEFAHRATFGCDRPSGMNRYDFALMTIDEDKPQTWMICRETDSESCYMHWGGAFDHARGIKAYKSFQMYMDYLQVKYKRVNVMTKNDNKPMIKLALSEDMKIIGTRTVDNETYVEFLKEF